MTEAELKVRPGYIDKPERFYQYVFPIILIIILSCVTKINYIVVPCLRNWVSYYKVHVVIRQHQCIEDIS